MNFDAICSLIGGFRAARSENYIKATLLTMLGAGFFAVGFYCKYQKTKIQNLPEPTKAEIYKGEKKANKLNRVEAGMQPVTLATDNFFYDAIQMIKLTDASRIGDQIKDYKKNYMSGIKELKTLACEQRNIDAVLVLTDLLEEAQKTDQNTIKDL